MFSVQQTCMLLYQGMFFLHESCQVALDGEQIPELIVKYCDVDGSRQ